MNVIYIVRSEGLNYIRIPVLNMGVDLIIIKIISTSMMANLSGRLNT